MNRKSEIIQTEKELQEIKNRNEENVNKINFLTKNLNKNSQEIDKLKNETITRSDLPTKLSELNNDIISNDFTNEYKIKVDGIENNANNYIHPQKHDVSMIEGISKIGKTGDYNDLVNKPIIPSINNTLTSDSNADGLSANQGKILNEKIGKINSSLEDMTKDIGDKTKLKTTNKNDLVNAVNELFTNANNGKQNWVDVIGLPLLNTDIFSTLKSKTQTLKNTFASNLTSKGQSASGIENLQDLINKVKNINIGKRVVTGSFYKEIPSSRSSRSEHLYIKYNLDFIPSKVLVFFNGYPFENIKNYNSGCIENGGVGYIDGTKYNLILYNSYLKEERSIRVNSVSDTQTELYWSFSSAGGDVIIDVNYILIE